MTKIQSDQAVAIADGWIPVSGTWAYASATTITVPSGAASIYSVGDKFKLTANSVVLYGYIIKIEDTLLTVVGNTLTAHTFSNCYHSKSSNPFNFPHFFAYTPVLTASVTNPTLGSSTLTGGFSINGRIVTTIFTLTIVSGGSFNVGSGNYRYSIPTSAIPVNVTLGVQMGSGKALDSGTQHYVLASYLYTNAGVDYIVLYVNASTGSFMSHNTPFTPANGDTINATISYFI